jgi:hypothetical protein
MHGAMLNSFALSGSGSTVVEHLPYHSKVYGSSPGWEWENKIAKQNINGLQTFTTRSGIPIIFFLKTKQLLS